MTKSDEMLISALLESAQQRYSFLCAGEKKHRFSLAYRLNKRSVIRRYNKHEKQKSLPSVMKIKILIVAVILSIFAVTGFCTYFVLNGFVFCVYPTYSQVSLKETAIN